MWNRVKLAQSLTDLLNDIQEEIWKRVASLLIQCIGKRKMSQNLV